LAEEIKKLKKGGDPKQIEALMAASEVIDAIPSTKLCSNLEAIRESGWYRYRNNRDPIDEGDVADLLGAFDIRPKTVRLNDHHKRRMVTESDTAKGYRLAWFATAFRKYLKPLEKDEAEPLAEQIKFDIATANVF
jgi:Protein of unknown function (DUF3631)